MNKHLYRIIFNQSRGQLMVVQEDACGQGKGNGAEGVAATLAAACKAFSLRLSVLLIGLGLGASALAADIIADPHAPAGKQPGMIQAANGLPVVQIAAPTAAGVSHNQYQQFNVGPGGALLNNSPVNANTQLAGYISGNANLKNGSARIILNEVTQPNPSQLRGYLEVAGQRAQVVIANPWGISCSGCGFINAPQATLTTGVPQLNAQGALTGYRVAGGRVSIDGQGLNAANVDSFAIISRAVSINANLYAQKLDLVLGRNQVDAATLAAQPLAASEADAPAFALDVAQLGGMYANAIKLVGTEKGVGVNQQGTMAAQAGDLQLTSAGDLILRGKTYSQRNLALQTDGQLRHDGLTRAEGNARIEAAGQATLHQALSAGGDLALEAGSLQGDGILAAGALADGKLVDHGRLAVTSAGQLRHSGQLLAGGDVRLQAGQADLSQAVVSASHGELEVQAAGDLHAQQARLGAAGAARLDIDGQFDNRDGQLSAGQVKLRLGELDNRQGQIVQTGQADADWRIAGAVDNRQGELASAAGQWRLQAASLDNRGGDISHAGGGALQLAVGELDNREQGRIASDSRLDAQAARLDNRQGRVVGVQAAAFKIQGQLSNDGGVLSSDGAATLAAGALDNGSGLIQAGKDLQLSATSLTNADKGQILALGKDVSSRLDVDGEIHSQGMIAGNADLTVNAATIDNAKGSLQAAGHLELSKQSQLSNDGGHIVAQSLNIAADALSNQGGEVYAQQQLASQLKTLDNSQGSLIGGQGVDLTVSDSLHNDGALGGAGSVKLTAGKLENAAGTIQSGKDLQLTAASLTNADKGQILALGQDAASKVDVSGELHNQGKVAGNADLTVNAASVDNTKGSLQAAGHLDLSKQSQLTNDGGHIVAQSLNVAADSLSNQAGEVYAQQQLSSRLKTLDNRQGSLIGGQGVDLAVSGKLHNDGVLGGDGAVKLTTGALDNGGGLIQSGKDLQLTASSLSNAEKGRVLALGKDAASQLDISGDIHNQGKIAGNAELTVNAATVDNVKGSLQTAGALNLTKQAALSNDGGHLAAQSLNIQTGSLSNQGGEIRQVGQGAASLRIGQDFNNQQGQLLSQGALTLGAGHLDNSRGVLASQGAQQLRLQALNNQNGVLASSRALGLILSGAADNRLGQIQGDSLQLSGQSLDNRGGAVKALGSDASRVSLSGMLDNSEKGALAVNGKLDLAAGQLNNQQGLLQSAALLSAQIEQDAQNRDGQLLAGQLSLSAASLGNQHGQIGQAGGELAKLDIRGQIDNSGQGKITANGQLQIHSGDIDNHQGVLSSQGDLTLRGGALNNRQGTLGSNGALAVNGASLDNSQGLLQAGQALQLDSGSLQNGGGKVLALGLGDSRLNVSGQFANGGQIAGNGSWQLNAQSLDNSGGSIYGQRNLVVNAATLANVGSMQAGQDLALTLQSDFVNTAGTQLQANRNLSISSSGNLFNNGELQTGGNLKLSGLNWTNNGNVNIGGALDTRLSQSLVNNGSLGAGALNLNAASIVNTASITAGDIAIHAGNLDNGGGKALLASAGNLALDVGGTLNNHDGAWLYSQGDMRIGQAGAQTGQVVNHVATLQSDGNMSIDAGRVSNESNPVSVVQSVSQSSVSRATLSEYGEATRSSPSQLIDSSAYKIFKLRDGDNYYTGFNTSSSCPEQGCGFYDASQFSIRIVNDDRTGHVLTVVSDSNLYLRDVSQSSYRRGGKYDGGLITGPGTENRIFEAGKATKVYYFGNPGSEGYDVIGFDFGKPPYDPGVNLLPQDLARVAVVGRDSIAKPGEQSRVTTTRVSVDVASGAANPGRILVGGSMSVSSGDVANTYSSIAVGDNLNMLAGNQVRNTGQQLLKTTTTTTQSNYGWGRTDSPTVETHTEVIGSLDATVATNQHLSLQAPTIVNGKGAPRVDAATMQAALASSQVMFDRTPGSANATDHAGQTQGAAQAVDAAAQPGKQALGVAAAAALANASPIRIDGQGALGGQYQPAPAHQQVTLQAGGAKAGNPVANGYAVPDNGMFHVKPAPQQPYLVETNPQFTQYKNFVSSDYLLKQLNYDPSKVEKRLGDGFYEQQLVSRAVTDLTGKRLLDGSRNAMEQYQQLMSNGAQYAKQFQLTPGMALSAEQMAKLTSDMVWLVKQNVGGQEVLVPMVYLANADQKSLRGQGAVLAGNSMSLQASGELINNGVLKADATLLAQAGAIRIEGGKVQAGGDLGLSARQNLTITDDAQHSQAGSSLLAGGNLQLQAGGDLKLQAVDARAGGNAWLQAGGDLDIGSRETSYSLGNSSGYGSFQYQQVDHVGSQLNIGGSLVLNAASDLTLSGSAVKAGGGILAAAGNKLTLESTQDSKHGAGNWRGGAYDTLSQSHHAATLQGGDIVLKAGGDLSLQGSSVQADGSLAAIAGKQLTLQSQVDTQRDSGYNWGGSHNWQTDSLTVAGLSSKGNLQASAGGDAVLNGASLSSDAKLALSAGNDIKLGAAATESRSDNTWGDTVRNHYDLTQHGSSLHGEAGLGLQAARDIRTQAASLASNGEAALLAGRDIYLGAADDAHSDYSKTVRSSGGFFKHKTTVDISAHQSTTQVGTNVSADTIRVQSGHDLSIVGSQLAGSGNVALQAGDNIDIFAGTNTSQSFQYHHEKTSGLFGLGGAGFMVGSKELTDALNANGVTQSQSKSLVGSLKGDLSVQAGHDLKLQGSSLSALGGNVDVGASSVAIGEGRDILVVDHDHIEKQRGFSVTEVNTLKNTFDNLKDVIHTQRGFGLLKGLANEAAASTSSQQGVDIAYSRSEQGSHEHSRTISSVGSAILAGGDIRLQASGKPADAAGSGDLTIAGSRLQGGGKVDLFANGSVNLLAGLNQRQDDSSSYRYDTRVSMYNQQMGDVIRALEGGPSHNGTSLSPYNQLRAESVGGLQDQQLQASEIRGDQIRVVGLGGDVNVVGATLQGVHDVSVTASQGSVNVLGGTEHYQSSQDSHSLTFGNIGGGNHSATVGAQHTWDQLAANGSAQSGGFSRIESQRGNVALSAADAITVAGAALQAGQDLSLTGKSLQIAPGVDQDQHSETHRMNQRGITGAVSSPILAAADAVTSMAEVASNKNTDARTRALAAGTASLAAYNGYQSAKSVSDGQLISGSLTFGASKSESREEGKSLANAETSLTAGRDLILQASGGGKDSNIDIAGSRLQAGRNATLQADNQIQLVSAQDSSSLRGENDSSGWGAGIAVSFGKGGFSFGGTANANHSFGKENGSTIDQRDTTVSAGDTLTLKSGGDATLKGAEARGQTIVANVGGNLDIESLQDQHQYQSSSKSMAGSVTIGYGFSASANYSQQKMDNDYASVRQQSGLKAGDGGYQVAVKGNTNLAGAVIASSDRAVADDKNSLSTGTLTTSDVYNHARSSGSSVGLAVSGSMGGGKDGDGKGGDAGGSSSSSSAPADSGNGAPASQSSGGNYSGAHVQQFGNGGSAGTSGVMASSQSAESVTRAGISGGKLAIADDAGQQALTGQSAAQAAAAVNRGVSSDRDGANALQDKFDKQQLQTAFTVAQTLTDQISTFTANKAAEAKAAKDLADRAKTDPSLSDEQKAQLQAQADQAAKWAPGGSYSQILTAATAGISGNVGNSLNGMAQNAGIAYLQGLGAQQIKQMVDELEKGDKTVAGETVRAVLHGALACAGAEASSQSCAAGAIGGAASVALNNALDKAQDTNSDKMTAEEKQQRENLVSSLLAGASVAAGATDTAATTVNAATTEMENNSLTKDRGVEWVEKFYKATPEQREKLLHKHDGESRELSLRAMQCVSESTCFDLAGEIKGNEDWFNKLAIAFEKAGDSKRANLYRAEAQASQADLVVALNRGSDYKAGFLSWGNGDNSAGLREAGEVRHPDYFSISVSGLGLSLNTTLNLYNLDWYGGLGGGGRAGFGLSGSLGWIDGNSSWKGKSEQLKNTKSFIEGGSISGSGCLMSVCVGMSHAIGGSTAAEIGLGVGGQGRLKLPDLPVNFWSSFSFPLNVDK